MSRPESVRKRQHSKPDVILIESNLTRVSERGIMFLLGESGPMKQSFALTNLESMTMRIAMVMCRGTGRLGQV